jgi:hypothetical protein
MEEIGEERERMLAREERKNIELMELWISIFLIFKKTGKFSFQ